MIFIAGKMQTLFRSRWRTYNFRPKIIPVYASSIFVSYIRLQFKKERRRKKKSIDLVRFSLLQNLFPAETSVTFLLLLNLR